MVMEKNDCVANSYDVGFCNRFIIGVKHQNLHIPKILNNRPIP
jgi:hypothetical protein